MEKEEIIINKKQNIKIVAILGGLGSQMIKYAFYLSVKEKCKNDKCIIDTTPFLTRNMWNGYELKKIFNIQEDDLANSYNEEEKHSLKNKSYRKIVLNKVHKLRTNVPIVYYDRGKKHDFVEENKLVNKIILKINWYVDNYLAKKSTYSDDYIDKYPTDYLQNKGVTYFDEFNHTSDEYFGDVKAKLKQIFKFPLFTDVKNQQLALEMLNCNSVAMHIRRSDHMYDNDELFNNGYFEKAVNYIKAKTENPSFYIFSEDLEWCKKNREKIGLSEKDKVTLVDWNDGDNSYKDMQLMTYCKHNILVISSFSWWGYYLSCNTKNKIVIAPTGYWFEVENHF